MAEAVRDASGRKIFRRGVTRGWLEVVGGVGLAVAAEPIHECGHAVAARLLTGLWPEISFWAVHPAGHFESTRAVVTVLAAGDAAVMIWWALMFLIAVRSPRHKWMLIGPTFMVSLALLNWIAAAALTPFGYGHLGASDAVKFIAASGIAWHSIAIAVGVICLAIVVHTWRVSWRVSCPRP
jgi:hypothetical protein